MAKIGIQSMSGQLADKRILTDFAYDTAVYNGMDASLPRSICCSIMQLKGCSRFFLNWTYLY